MFIAKQPEILFQSLCILQSDNDAFNRFVEG
jgi:hypothetical protein